MLQRFIDYATQQHLFSQGQKVLLAVSGGRDSVVMADLFHRAGIPFEIAHCNFNLRPGDCDRDEAFVHSSPSATASPAMWQPSTPAPSLPPQARASRKLPAAFATNTLPSYVQ